MLPNSIQKAMTVLSARILCLENRFTGVLHLEQVAIALKLRSVDLRGLAVTLEGKLHGDA